jgi:hypothetical protein
MNIVRFEPWSMIDLINRDLVRRPANAGAQSAVADWVPAVDQECPVATLCCGRTSLV